MNHAGEAAELHALGLLDAGERAALERHAAACPVCMRRIGHAEESAALLVSVLPAIEPSAELLQRLSDVPRSVSAARAALPQAPSGLGADDPGGRAQRMADRWASERRRSARLQMRSYAAALAIVGLIVGLTFSLFRVAESNAALHGDDVALNLLARSDFETASLTPASDLAPKAKVLFAKDGSWLYVLVAGDAGRLRVSVTLDGATRDLGPLRQRGDVATLFTQPASAPTHVALRDAAGDVASTDITY